MTILTNRLYLSAWNNMNVILFVLLDNGGLAAAVEHGERERGAEARASAAAGGAGARGAVGARAGGPHARRRRPHRAHQPRLAAWAQARHQDCCANPLLQLQGNQVTSLSAHHIYYLLFWFTKLGHA